MRSIYLQIQIKKLSYVVKIQQTKFKSYLYIADQRKHANFRNLLFKTKNDVVLLIISWIRVFILKHWTFLRSLELTERNIQPSN